MLVSTHIIISFLIALVLYPFFGIYSIIFFLAGFLIDFDHYIEYSIVTKDFNPFDSYKNLLKIYKTDKRIIKEGKSLKIGDVRFHVFHSVEFILLIGVLGFFSKILFFIFLGFASHVLLDVIYSLYLKLISKEKIFYRRYYYSATVFLLKTCLMHKK